MVSNTRSVIQIIRKQRFVTNKQINSVAFSPQANLDLITSSGDIDYS
jgi:hypothetical protein